MDTFKKNGVCEKVPIEEYKGKPEYHCRIVAKEIKNDKREDLFAATPLLEAEKMLFSICASAHGTRTLEMWFVLAFAQEQGEGVRGAVKREL